MSKEKKVFSGEIRPAEANDIPAVLRMVSELADHHGDVATVTTRELARDILGPQPWVRILLALDADETIGYAALCPLAQMQFGVRGMDLQHLYVIPEARQMGVGKALIKASQRLAQHQGCRYLIVGTHPDNTLAQQIYPALGFDEMDPPGPRFRIRFEVAV
ncbi:GNAT family N-acetyltransferase [uncultured Roseobacter sp.]|uniref:GNAT family N-acetyltransferase n=1 Tax=uncultured Roseobacter sp. TaxID=114847 RepID=UPI0026233D2B|nr:GNAT family N-acetyltransferase [uncultured Roseobacter sp.]